MLLLVGALCDGGAVSESGKRERREKTGEVEDRIEEGGEKG